MSTVKRCRIPLAVIIAGAAVASLTALAAQPQPAAPVRPVTDVYFGTAVVDNYRYMENLDDPEVQAWMKSQADYTRATLDTLPGRDALLQRIHALNNADVGRRGFIRRGKRYFYRIVEPGAQQPKLYYRDGLNGEEHLLLDPSTLGIGSKTHYALDFYTPSWDGRFVAYGISAGVWNRDRQPVLPRAIMGVAVTLLLTVFITIVGTVMLMGGGGGDDSVGGSGTV